MKKINEMSPNEILNHLDRLDKGNPIPDRLLTEEEVLERGLKPFIVCFEPKVMVFGYAPHLEYFSTPLPNVVRNRTLVFYASETQSVTTTSIHGPRGNSRVSVPSNGLKIHGRIWAVIPCTEEARKQWEKGVWA